jgi:hypothetical protein
VIVSNRAKAGICCQVVGQPVILRRALGHTAYLRSIGINADEMPFTSVKTVISGDILPIIVVTNSVGGKVLMVSNRGVSDRSESRIKRLPWPIPVIKLSNTVTEIDIP